MDLFLLPGSKVMPDQNKSQKENTEEETKHYLTPDTTAAMQTSLTKHLNSKLQ